MSKLVFLELVLSQTKVHFAAQSGLFTSLRCSCTAAEHLSQGLHNFNPLGLRASSFSLNGAHLKQKSTLLRKVWAFFVFSAF
jgi:hypothetical protein